MMYIKLLIMHAAVREIFCGSDYLNLKKLGSEEIIWVDEIDGLLNATNYIEGCKIIGLDCEWKHNFEKNSEPSKVSKILICVISMFASFLYQRISTDICDRNGGNVMIIRPISDELKA
jgi:hypothetical protein